MAETLREHPRPGSNSNGQIAVASTLKSQRGKGGGGVGPEETFVAAPLTKGSASGEGVNQPGRRQEDDVNLVAYALRKDPGGTGQGHNTNYVAAAGVRRLTPTECERLQGLPDDWTKLDAKTPDSRRYSALGDAVTATVSEWIGRRLLEVAA